MNIHRRFCRALATALAASTLAVAGLAGCGGAADAGADERERDGGGEATLTVLAA